MQEAGTHKWAIRIGLAVGILTLCQFVTQCIQSLPFTLGVKVAIGAITMTFVVAIALGTYIKKDNDIASKIIVGGVTWGILSFMTGLLIGLRFFDDKQSLTIAEYWMFAAVLSIVIFGFFGTPTKMMLRRICKQQA